MYFIDIKNISDVIKMINNVQFYKYKEEVILKSKLFFIQTTNLKRGNNIRHYQ